MENEENKVSLEKNDNEMNNETNVSSYQNENYGQQEQQNVGNTNPYGNTENSWNNAGYQDVNGQGASQSTFSPSGFAIASLVLGILSLVCCCFWYVAGIFAVLGLAFSIIVLVKHKPGEVWQ